MSGRPRALDDVKRREVCALLSAGCGLEGAARYVGCNPITIRREAARNPEFHEQLRAAELTAQVTPLQAMRKAASTHWRAAAWFLERTQPHHFAPRRPLTLSVEEVGFYIGQIMEVFDDEVHDPAVRRRLIDGVNAVQRALSAQQWAIETPRRNVHQRLTRERELRNALVENRRTRTLAHQENDPPTNSPSAEVPPR